MRAKREAPKSRSSDRRRRADSSCRGDEANDYELGAVAPHPEPCRQDLGTRAAICLGAALRFNHAVGGSVSPRGEAVLGVRRASAAATTASRSFAVAGPGAGHNIGPGI